MSSGGYPWKDGFRLCKWDRELTPTNPIAGPYENLHCTGYFDGFFVYSSMELIF